MGEAQRTVLITGGTDGLGRAAALLLAEKGYRVFASGRSAERRAELDAIGASKKLPVESLELDVCDEASVSRGVQHVLQSAGTLAFNQTVDEIVRAGMVLYGISPLPGYQELLKPAMTWKTHVGLIRDMPEGASISYGRTFITPKPMKVATLTAGYADGYPRHLSNVGAEMLVRGKRCPLLGRVTMDLTVVDVSNVPDVETGDEVVLMGRQGDAEIPCVELADKANTITWEITTRIGQRVKRVFI